MDNADRIKQLDSLISTIDSPKEGDEVGFMLEGDLQVYRGIIQTKVSEDGFAKLILVAKTRPAPIGKVSQIIYKGKMYKAGGERV